MDKRKIFFKIIIFITVLVLIEKGIRFLIEKYTEQKIMNEEKQIAEQYYNSYEETIKRKIEQFTKNVCDAINDKDYEYVFTSLDDTYKNYMFNSDIETMKNYLENNLMLSETYQIIDISNAESLYNVIIGFETNDGYKTQYFSIKIINEDFFSILFGDYDEFQEENTKYITSNIEYNLNYKYGVDDLTCYVLDIKNKSFENLEITFNNINLIFRDGSSIGANKLNKAMIESNNTERIQLVFNKDSIVASFIRLDLDLNNNNQIIEIPFNNSVM